MLTNYFWLFVTGGGAFDDQLFEHAGEHGFERGDTEPERKIHDLWARRYRQAGVADDDVVGVAQPGQGSREPRVYNAFPFHSASTTSWVGSAPWAPSLVTAAAPARTA